MPQSDDLKLLLASVESLVKLGAPIAISDILERFGFATPGKNAELLGAATRQSGQPGQDSQDAQETQLNADQAEDLFLAKAGKLLAKASREDRENLVGELKAVLSSPEGTQLNALAAFVERLPENIGQDSAQVRAWEALLASALVNGFAAAQPSTNNQEL